MLKHHKNPQAAQDWCNKIRAQGKSIGFVATMGALHEGHFDLFRRAQAENDVCIVSIFVNPLQFNKAEDLANYPRDDAADIKQLSRLNMDAVFTGSPKDFLGNMVAKSADALPDAGIYAKGLEGVYRPGHFEGVQAVVSRLLDFVGACQAYFGEKDFQQLQIIRQFAQPKKGIEIIGCQTSREQSGLARSSRNARLSEKGIHEAAIIYQAMQAAKEKWQVGCRLPKDLQAAMHSVLDSAMIDLEYAQIRDPNNWTLQQPESEISQARAFIAGNIEGVRLIDNMALSKSS